ncbi:Uncharacterized protein F383_01873 [Gossypium arboreum]|uniref:Uncharacterized protein n=1 Tax=Gossypium arboreum TaxID=29729 RepID=A0A0B0PPI9_GOSAR|nr:Uncharacterized protein F383_01873 [Gossypium arboreum]
MEASHLLGTFSLSELQFNNNGGSFRKGWKVAATGVGSCFPPFSIACYDIYDNRMSFTSIPDLKITLGMNEYLSVDVVKMKPSLSSDKLAIVIEDVMVETNGLDSIRPNYAATLMIYIQDESTSIPLECQVTPGALHRIEGSSQLPGKQLLPGFVIEQFVLEMFDVYGNHVEEGLEVQFQLNGFSIPGLIGSKHKVDNLGRIDLGGLLKVTAGYGKQVSLSILHGDKVTFKQAFQTEKRELRISSSISLVHAPNVDTDENEVQSSDGKLMLLQNSPFFNNGNVGNLLALVKYDEGLKSELCKHGERVGKLENYLKTLNNRKTDIELYMSELQDVSLFSRFSL